MRFSTKSANGEHASFAQTHLGITVAMAYFYFFKFEFRPSKIDCFVLVTLLSVRQVLAESKVLVDECGGLF